MDSFWDSIFARYITFFLFWHLLVFLCACFSSSILPPRPSRRKDAMTSPAGMSAAFPVVRLLRRFTSFTRNGRKKHRSWYLHFDILTYWFPRRMTSVDVKMWCDVSQGVLMSATERADARACGGRLAAVLSSSHWFIPDAASHWD